MARYIDADLLMKEFCDFVRPSNNSDFAPVPNWNDAVSLVGSAPTADVAEVVRCKDCAYKQYYFTNDMVKCGCGNGAHHEEFFCADGERRDDGEIGEIHQG